MFFLSSDTSTLVRAFKAYVRPLLEYCYCVWSPHLKNGIYKVASVQRNFTKRLRGLSNLPYSDRLAVLNLPSLELRRLGNDLIWCYKILFELLACQLMISLSSVLLNAHVGTVLNCSKDAATAVHGLFFQWACSKRLEFVTTRYQFQLCSRF